jgi:Ca2+-binding EF-hand superfamily protein
MKTGTKVLIAVSLVILVSGIAVVGSSFADRRWHGQHGSEYGPMAFQERHEHRGEPGEHHGQSGWHMRGERLIESFDSNNDNKLSQTEIDQARHDRFTQFDMDKDGKLSLQEYQALWLDAMRRHMVARFQALDDDGDATVTTEEFIAPFGQVVRRLDRNDDGELTRDEFRRR